MLSFDDEAPADKRFEQITEALKNRDKDMLKAVFSDTVLTESQTMDEDIEYLFSFFQGEILSWEGDARIVDYGNDFGVKTKEIKSKYFIDTDKQRYIAYIIDNTVDTAHPENVGLYTLRIIREEDKETQFAYWPDMKIPGIYRYHVMRNDG